MAEVVMIAAVARNGVIGNGTALPWHLPEDLKHFRSLTMGSAVIMGRKTWDSLPEHFRPLPGRRNIVVTRQPGWSAPGAETADSPAAAVARLEAAERAFVIGGAELYAALLPWAHRLQLTEIDREFDGNVHFPAFDRTQFVETAREPHRAAPPNDFEYAFVSYQKT